MPQGTIDRLVASTLEVEVSGVKAISVLVNQTILGSISRSLPHFCFLQTNSVPENSQMFFQPSPTDSLHAAPLFQRICECGSIDVGLSVPVNISKEKCAQA